MEVIVTPARVMPVDVASQASRVSFKNVVASHDVKTIVTPVKGAIRVIGASEKAKMSMTEALTTRKRKPRSQNRRWYSGFVLSTLVECFSKTNPTAEQKQPSMASCMPISHGSIADGVFPEKGRCGGGFGGGGSRGAPAPPPASQSHLLSLHFETPPPGADPTHRKRGSSAGG
jgi:hypothetical protein